MESVRGIEPLKSQVEFQLADHVEQISIQFTSCWKSQLAWAVVVKVLKSRDEKDNKARL